MPTAAQTAPATAVVSGMTFTSPSIYLSYSGIYAQNTEINRPCGISVETGWVTALADQISTLDYEDNVYPLNLLDLDPIVWTAWKRACYYCTDTTIASWEYHPWIRNPPGITRLHPAFKTCNSVASVPQGKVVQPYGGWDPPVKLSLVKPFLDPDPTAIPITSDTPGISSSTPAQPHGNQPPQPTATTTRLGAAETLTPGRDIPSQVPEISGAPKPAQATDNPNSQDPHPNQGVGDAIAAMNLGGVTITLQPDGSVKVGGLALRPGDQPVNTNGHIVCLGQSNNAGSPSLMIDGWTVSFTDPKALKGSQDPNDPGDSTMAVPIVMTSVAGLAITELVGGTVIIDGSQTVVSGGPPATANGVVVSIGPDPNGGGTALLVNGTQVPVPSLSPLRSISLSASSSTGASTRMLSAELTSTPGGVTSTEKASSASSSGARWWVWGFALAFAWS
ncbi:hypothetical protein AOQ84DRAFT_383391 [Glonium stellatum]|uniref:Uncharacterized protein n=1 Tax=Glonium stellatum TaxID=574774 RepID=A0A8E2ENI6_9PEZI|nr:hypothetical protein AOQ84DRAFT_383391 [Glonium stellatum]